MKVVLSLDADQVRVLVRAGRFAACQLEGTSDPDADKFLRVAQSLEDKARAAGLTVRGKQRAE